MKQTNWANETRRRHLTAMALVGVAQIVGCSSSDPTDDAANLAKGGAAGYGAYVSDLAEAGSSWSSRGQAGCTTAGFTAEIREGVAGAATGAIAGAASSVAGGTSTNAGEAESGQSHQEWVGWLIDTDCVGSNPYTHTQNCNLMPTCIASGFGIYVYAPNKPYDTYQVVDWIPFDNASQSLARQIDWVLSEPSAHESHLSTYPNRIPTIRVIGHRVAVENIVSINDEGLVLADYGNWSEAIHVHSIEFFYIDGVSAYQVQGAENVVLKE